MVKFAWYEQHLPRWARRVLIVGQYKTSNTKDDFVQESNAENAAPCTVIMQALATRLRAGAPSREVRLVSVGLNEDFALLTRAPLLLGSGSRFS